MTEHDSVERSTLRLPTSAMPKSPIVFDDATDQVELMRLLLDTANEGEESLDVLRGYRFERELGRGGMGAVGLIRQVEIQDLLEPTEEQLALKIMLPRRRAKSKAREQFLREIQNAKALSQPKAHPHIVAFHDSGCWRDVFFYTMEYCDAGSVSELVDKRGPMPAEEAIAITLQSLNGLNHTHHAEVPYIKLNDGTIGRGHGLVHRDVKPQNILLTGSENGYVAKLGDYGLSKSFEFAGLTGKTRSGDIGGSLACMPRQQLLNYKYAKAEVDVWAMAACLYFMLTGKYPREFPEGEKSPIWLTEIIRTTDPVRIRERGVEISDKLADLLDEALDDRRQLRFQSVAAFTHALEQALRAT